MVWCSHLLENFPQLVVIHRVEDFDIANKAVDVFLELFCFFYDPRQFDLWFPCLFKIQVEHLEVHSSHTAEAWLGEF